MNIGQIIKKLRQQNNMSQTQLATLLGVSYQAVSKWETNISSPDLSLILPIARVFHVSTDVLFNYEKNNNNRDVFDNAYNNYWLKNVKEMYNTAKQAVIEFPSDYKYLQWFAYMEYYTALDEVNNDSFISMLNNAKKHFDIVINNCTDNEIRQKALYGIILVLKELNNLNEAKKYANLPPEREEYNKDMLLELCSENEELLQIRQKIIYKKLNELLNALNNMFKFQNQNTKYVNEAINISECIINAFIPNKEYYRFYWNLYLLYLKKAEVNMEDNDYDNAINNLKTAKSFAIKRDSYNFSKECQYTNTIFDHIKDDLSCELSPTDSIDYFNHTINKPLFNKLRNRNDFIKLVKS